MQLHVGIKFELKVLRKLIVYFPEAQVHYDDKKQFKIGLVIIGATEFETDACNLKPIWS